MPFSTALAKAIQTADIRIIEPLITEEKAWDEPNEEGLKPIHVAIDYGHLDVVDWLLKNGVSLECSTVPNGLTPLHRAAFKGQIKIVEYLLKIHQDNPNRKRADGVTPLHFAAQKGHTDTVALLLGHGADIRQAKNNGASPLYIAAANGHTETVALLLEHKADIGQADNCGISPLFVAACNGHTATVALLLEHKADIGQVDNDGTSPLYVAAGKGHTETVALLLEHKADIGKVDNGGASPLYIAAGNGHTETVALLLEHKADIGQATNDNSSPLYIAAQEGHTETVALLLEHKADIGQAMNNNSSPLLVAAHNGHIKTVALLLKHKADIGQANDKGQSPLYIAAQEGHTATVALLLEHKADIGQVTKDGRSPLWAAASNGHRDTVALLLEHKADIGQARKDGASPLLIAASNGHTATVALLLEHKADIAQATKNGASPLYVAAYSGHTATAALLLEHKADIGQVDKDGGSPLYIAAYNGHRDVVALLLEHKADISQAGNDGRSPLYVAAQQGHRDTVALLLEHKADIGQTNNNGASPLYSAAHQGHRDIAALLLEYKADIGQANNNGATPLHVAAQNGHIATVTLLLEHKVDIGQVRKDGASPLYIAAGSGHTEIVALLIKHGALLEQATSNKQTPLWIAAHEGHDKVVQILLTNSALMTPNDKGNTPLHIAVINGHLAVIKLLLSKRANVTAMNAEQETPLMLAARLQDAIMFGCLLAAWLQQPRVLTIQDTEHERDLERKNVLEFNFSGGETNCINQYKMQYLMNSYLIKEESEELPKWFPLPSAALSLAKAMRQSLRLEINQEQLKSAPKLGEGAFGEVFQMVMPFGAVAIKLMKLEQVAEWFKVSQQEASNILQWEISQLEKVRHLHVVELLNVVDSDTPLLAMELCDTTLDKVAPKTAYCQWQIAWEIACGLAYLHDSKLVHRDIKPGNILLKDGIAKIADMGLARIDPLLLDKPEPAQLEKLIGATLWASPEEKAAFEAYRDGKGSVEDIKNASTAAADIYRYGFVLAACTHDSNLSKPCHPILHPIIEACLHKDPKTRPSALQVLGFLEENIPHPHPVLAKLCQRLGIFAHYHQHELTHFLSPWVSPKPDIDWLTYQEGIEVKGDDAPQPFNTLWDEFLVNPNKSTLDLRGTGGLGKTLLGYYQLKEQWQTLRQWLIKPLGNPPALVLLLTPDYLATTAFTIEERLAEIYQLNRKECEILKQYPVVFLCDGEDEWQARPKLDLNNWPNAKAWIVGRPSASAKDSVYLLPFNQVQIVNYLRQTLTWDEATTRDFITQLPASAIKEVLRNPFVLSMFRLLWPIANWQKLTKEAIYHTYFTQFIEKQQQHWLTGPYRKIYEELIKHLQQQHPSLSESYLNFAGKVSLQLFEERRLEGKVMVDSLWTTIPEKVQRLAEKAFEEKQQLLLAKNEKSRLTLQQYQAFALTHLNRFVLPAPLELGYYRFRHKSLFEYAWAYSALIPNRPLEEDEALLTTYALIHQEEKLDFSLIEASKNNPTLAPKAGNLLTLYNWARMPLTYNYQGTHIDNANLAYANLIQADFRNAYLNNCYFAHAYLENARFDKAPDRMRTINRLHPPLLSHSQPILYSAMSPNGQLLATLDCEQVFIWHKQQCVRHFLTHIIAPTALAINDKGELLIGDKEGYVYFYLDQMRQRKLHAHFESILGVEFINEDLCWAGSIDDNILYHRKHYTRERRWPNQASATCSAFHSLSWQHSLGDEDGVVIMLSLKDTLVKNIWNYSIHQGASTALSFSLTGTLATGGHDGNIMIFEQNHGSPLQTLYTALPIKNLHWSQDSQLLIATSSEGFKIWEVSSGRQLANFKAATIQAVYMKDSHEGILVEQSGNLYGITLKNGEINITWVVAGEHFQGGITIEPISEAPTAEQTIKGQEEAKIEQQPGHNNQALLAPVLQQQGLFADRNPSDQEQVVNTIDDPSQKTRSSISTLL